MEGEAESDSDTVDRPSIQVVEVFMLPQCRCSTPMLLGVLFVDGEEFGRCFECLNRVASSRLSPEERRAYYDKVMTRIACISRPNMLMKQENADDSRKKRQMQQEMADDDSRKRMQMKQEV